MKNNKILIVVIILLIIICCAVSIAFYINRKDNTSNKTNNIAIKNKVNKNENTKGGSNLIEDPNKFKGKDKTYWENKVKEYIIKNYEYTPKEVKCNYTQAGNFVATVITEYEVANEYIFDSKTGNAEETISGAIIDFENGEIVEHYSNIPFENNEFISVAYILDDLVDAYKNNYFFDTTINFEDIEVLDLRMNTNEDGNRFYVVPKNHNVKISLYMLNDDGGEATLLRDEIDKPFVLLSDYIEYIPKHRIEFEYKDYSGNEKKGNFDFSFNGYDNKLNLPNNNEFHIFDSSLYGY